MLRAIVERLEPSLREPLLRQAARAEVTGGCDCGCATVYLEVIPADGDAVELPTLMMLEGEDVQFVDPSTGDVGGGVLVSLTEDGYLAGMEFYSYEAPYKAPPHVGDLRFYPRDV